MDKCACSSLSHWRKLRHIMLDSGPSFYSSIIKVLVYNFISTIIIHLFIFLKRKKNQLLLNAPLTLQPALTARMICHCCYHNTASSSSDVVSSTLSTNCWDLHGHPALTDTLLAGNRNCLWFSCVCHKTTRVAALTCQRVINTKRR